MAKGKPVATVQNRPMYSRISFLQQAATYLTQASEKSHDEMRSGQAKPISTGAARRLVTDLRSVSLKTRIRLSPAVKQTMCKYCDALLIEGETCTTVIENKSKGGKKPWADILVRKCHACGNAKRHPLNSARQKRKSLRAVGTEQREDGDT
ncbi:Rpr2-domain-containing protein [Coniochaeta ligniaria NRRL 30616]|uniref:Rpr2-domain-containing protein n=1 Tax=Coniochaeta ligniaria NRRL 30616 TaxID=1408157 RepID=A0A1J7JMA4_9PEZI|nr:Rpr2-domain-containing protein [Coniochaeta ligniaria NRRL 30616]